MDMATGSSSRPILPHTRTLESTSDEDLASFLPALFATSKARVLAEMARESPRASGSTENASGLDATAVIVDTGGSNNNICALGAKIDDVLNDPDFQNQMVQSFRRQMRLQELQVQEADADTRTEWHISSFKDGLPRERTPGQSESPLPRGVFDGTKEGDAGTGGAIAGTRSDIDMDPNSQPAHEMPTAVQQQPRSPAQALRAFLTGSLPQHDIVPVKHVPDDPPFGPICVPEWDGFKDWWVHVDINNPPATLADYYKALAETEAQALAVFGDPLELYKRTLEAHPPGYEVYNLHKAVESLSIPGPALLPPSQHFPAIIGMPPPPPDDPTEVLGQDPWSMVEILLLLDVIAHYSPAEAGWEKISQVYNNVLLGTLRKWIADRMRDSKKDMDTRRSLAQHMCVDRAKEKYALMHGRAVKPQVESKDPRAPLQNKQHYALPTRLLACDLPSRRDSERSLRGLDVSDPIALVQIDSRRRAPYTFEGWVEQEAETMPPPSESFVFGPVDSAASAAIPSPLMPPEAPPSQLIEQPDKPVEVLPEPRPEYRIRPPPLSMPVAQASLLTSTLAAFRVAKKAQLTEPDQYERLVDDALRQATDLYAELNPAYPIRTAWECWHRWCVPLGKMEVSAGSIVNANNKSKGNFKKPKKGKKTKSAVPSIHPVLGNLVNFAAPVPIPGTFPDEPGVVHHFVKHDPRPGLQTFAAAARAHQQNSNGTFEWWLRCLRGVSSSPGCGPIRPEGRRNKSRYPNVPVGTLGSNVRPGIFAWFQCALVNRTMLRLVTDAGRSRRASTREDGNSSEDAPSDDDSSDNSDATEGESEKMCGRGLDWLGEGAKVLPAHLRDLPIPPRPKYLGRHN
ncbi:hypothetical protein SCP_0802350 [Sparassis crispa]|uniref:Uncharacterized protein n=1 Tax=Sparassis crispa TaxID=139825 RepID=A0A401GU51_9APHY|nr:hypothetical protein SCP_0802350 [Sparassis crispa]GBE85713.1 hypothetical protein SCP_0802350 [Sparassis crispa]